MVEALRIAVVTVCLAVAIGVLRGVPDIEVLRGPVACAPPDAARPSVRWIDPGDAAALIGDVTVAFVDARAREAFEAGHVSGAINLPMDSGALAPGAMRLVDGAGTVVAYCDASGDCASSKRLAALLSDAGLRDVRVLRGGIPQWLEGGYPAEAGPCRVCP